MVDFDKFKEVNFFILFLFSTNEFVLFTFCLKKVVSYYIKNVIALNFR